MKGSKGKKSAVVICPGRGTYNKDELGYLAKHHSKNKEASAFILEIDAARTSLGQVSISELDNMARFKSRLHGTGDNASALIYACALADFRQINLDQYEIVAVTGNSMGWYLSLACAGVLRGQAGFDVVNTMGNLMQTQGGGGQVIYPLVDTDWRQDPELERQCDETVAELNSADDNEIYTSIELGGMRILAGNDAGVKALLDKLPAQQDRFPFQLQHHSAFHSPLLNHIPKLAKAALDSSLFSKADIPLIDGRGKIWQPGAYPIDAIYDYTFEHQVCNTYDFSRAIEVCLKEFAPDHLIILGPGTTLGPPVAQELIKQRWLGLSGKSDFISMQEDDPFVLSMGIEAQRQLVC
ncbi:MAG: ACP S-malonyltransferase [Proteobacteria bacterium]|nr:ACP S-malonyltransferase [Pseudomonadota bacterium]